MDLNEDQIESLIETINIHCFKRGLSAEEFVNIINKVVALSQILGIPVDQLPHYIRQGKLEMQKVKEETEDAKVKQLQVLRHYNVTMNDLEEYRRNKPLVDRIRQLEQEIDDMAREIKRKDFEIITLEYKHRTGQQ
jgi:peptidoglycan hydrolase CwlO-like protein